VGTCFVDASDEGEESEGSDVFFGGVGVDEEGEAVGEFFDGDRVSGFGFHCFDLVVKLRVAQAYEDPPYWDDN